jgi:hypothetical protein
MNKQDQQIIDFLNMYIIPVAAIIVLLLLVIFLFFPKYQSIMSNIQNSSTVDDNISVLNTNISSLNTAQKSNSYYQQTITSFEVIIPTEAKVSEITSRLEQIAKNQKYNAGFFVSAKAQENVDLNGKPIDTSVSTGDTPLPNGISSVNLVITVQGSLTEVHNFSADLLSDNRLYTINSVAWSTQDGAYYVAQYKLTAYYADKITTTTKINNNVEDSFFLQPITPLKVDINKKQIDDQTSKIVVSQTSTNN